MPIVDILFSYYYDKEGKKPQIGGIQTYILRLSELCGKLGFKTRIFQYAEKNFARELSSSVTLIGVEVGEKNKNIKLYEYALKDRKDDKYLTIFATDTLIPNVKVENSIAIQHGISWDIPRNRKESLFRSFLSKSVTSYKTVKRILNVDKVVCVDNNFINWFRTQIWERNVELIPIMNFANIPKTDIVKEKDNIKIIFARRFVEYRGTKLFAQVSKRLLSKYENVYITFAGDGPDKKYLEDIFKDNTRVEITQYKAENSVDFHKDYDIAVVPTVGSEGTSLSLLEAMAARCAVVCSNVGGMTNIILDHFNGLIVNPDVDSFYEAICELIERPLLLEEISINSRNTVEKAFSYEIWENRWKKVLLESFDKNSED